MQPAGAAQRSRSREPEGRPGLEGVRDRDGRPLRVPRERPAKLENALAEVSKICATVLQKFAKSYQCSAQVGPFSTASAPIVASRILLRVGSFVDAASPRSGCDRGTRCSTYVRLKLRFEASGAPSQQRVKIQLKIKSKF